MAGRCWPRWCLLLSREIIAWSFAVVARARDLRFMLLLSVKMFLLFNSAAAGANGFQLRAIVQWVPSVGISYHVGVDGINVGLILMGAIVRFAAACVSWEIKRAKKNFTFCCW